MPSRWRALPRGLFVPRTLTRHDPQPSQAFVLFMLRDVQKVADPKYTTSMLAMVRPQIGR